MIRRAKQLGYALEQLETAFYTQVIDTPYSGITEEETIWLTDIRDHEVEHRDFLKEALADGAIPDLEVDFSDLDFTDRKAVLTTAQTFEDLGVAAYNGAGKLIEDPDYLLQAGRIVSVEARHAAAIRDLLKPTKPEPANTEDVKVAGAAGELDARIYWPDGATAGEALPLIVYFHGGGWVIADLDVYDASPLALANRAKAVVVSVHYRQGPEDKFPAAHDDAIAAFKDIVARSGEWNADAERLALAGESAGGNLALNVAIAARDQQLRAPDAVIAVYPVAGSDLNTHSYIENQNAVPLAKADIEWFVGHYLNSMDEAKDPRIDIVGGAVLDNLPPVTIIAAEIDPLNTEGMTLRDKLDAAGNDVTYQNWNGVTHEFFGMAAVVPEAKEAQDLAGTELKEAFGG